MQRHDAVTASRNRNSPTPSLQAQSVGILVVNVFTDNSGNDITITKREGDVIVEISFCLFNLLINLFFKMFKIGFYLLLLCSSIVNGKQIFI